MELLSNVTIWVGLYFVDILEGLRWMELGDNQTNRLGGF